MSVKQQLIRPNYKIARTSINYFRMEEQIFQKRMPIFGILFDDENSIDIYFGALSANSNF